MIIQIYRDIIGVMPRPRAYLASHHWLTFTLDTRRIPAATWLLLGEARSKCEHLAGVPLRPGTATQLNQIYLAKGALATTAIEGNTLSEEQALLRVKGELKLPPSKEYLGREIDNIVAACTALWDELAKGNSVDVTRARILAWNQQVLAGLHVAPEVVPGQVRAHSVGVARYRGAPAQDCDYLLDRLCAWLRELTVSEADGIVPAVIAAVLAHLYVAWIHPFGDGNGRTARLVEYAVLVSAGVPMPAAHLLSNHYNETRTEYCRQLDAASRSGGDVVPFVHYAVQGFVDGLREQLATVREQQLDVAWRNFVHEKFRQHRSESDKRRRDLVLDLSRAGKGAVPISELATLNPSVALAYASKTPRTLYRDVAALREMKLVESADGMVRARRELIEAFLPPKGQPAQRASNHGDFEPSDG